MAAQTRRTWSSRQTELLDDLESLFLSAGFRHLTIGEMAARVRCSRRTLYGIAESKEELVALVVERFYNRLGREARRRASEVPDPVGKIGAYMSASVDRYRDLSPEFNADMLSYGPTRQVADRQQELAMHALQEILEDGAATGIIRAGEPKLLAEILDAALQRIRDPEALANAGSTRSDALRTLIDLLAHGLT
ncbi:TetR/AcrR family transcriptional regulator [Streptomyces sp. NPDC056938]|uniref:TetR/AcrR family transcriptional regulator n=1 Tax=unclassified Streptomyces TaxID=2593676 RepID=UPI00363F3512